MKLSNHLLTAALISCGVIFTGCGGGGSKKEEPIPQRSIIWAGLNMQEYKTGVPPFSGIYAVVVGVFDPSGASDYVMTLSVTVNGASANSMLEQVRDSGWIWTPTTVGTYRFTATGTRGSVTVTDTKSVTVTAGPIIQPDGEAIQGDTIILASGVPQTFGFTGNTKALEGSFVLNGGIAYVDNGTIVLDSQFLKAGEYSLTVPNWTADPEEKYTYKIIVQ